MKISKFLDKNGDYFYLVFRVIVGLVFLLHGVAKIGTPLMSLMGLAMVIEIVAGACIILGLFTRIVAVIAALEMAYAFIIAHTIAKGTVYMIGKDGNGGEAALLFFAAFLAIAAFGARRFGIDKK